MEEVAELLESCRGPTERGRAFISFLSPLVAALAPYVQREIRVREYDGTLVGESITASDILDEVLVSAWERFPRRAKTLALDLWLVQLADECIERLGKCEHPQSLEDETPVPKSELEEMSWAELAIPSEAIELRDLVPAAEQIDAWDGLDFESKQEHVAKLFAGLPRERRQAFVLKVVHGFNSAEIADFQGRSVADVESDIAAASAAIERRVLEEFAPDPEEPFARRELREFRRKRH
jgi:DNA-directed RNA polymerase specialized sigma24 family protein